MFTSIFGGKNAPSWLAQPLRAAPALKATDHQQRSGSHKRRKGGNRRIFRTVKRYNIYIYCVCVDFAHGNGMGSMFLCISACHRGCVFFSTFVKPCHLQTSLAWNVWLQFDSRILVFSATANFKDKILEPWCTKIIANDYWSSLI